MDIYKIDGHKLHYHPERIAQWLTAGDDWELLKKVYPLYIEISPTGMCNHRCRFCAMDYIGYRPNSLDLGIMKKALREMGENGVKSVMLAGEGEPLLFKEICELSKMVVDSGIDLAFTTNGVLLDGKRAETILPISSWIKVSIAAGTPETYAYIHGTDKSDFARVTDNLERAADIRDKNGYSCTLGAQFLILPDNYHELETIIRICRDETGIDYIVVKPYSQHLYSNTREYENMDYSEMTEAVEAAGEMGNDRFRVIVRKEAMETASAGEHMPEKCFATPFLWAHIMSNHDLYSCSAFLDDKRFLIGNLNEKSFSDAWENDSRKEIYKMMNNGFNTSDCRLNCRMNAANSYLRELKKPGAHDNFI